MRIVGLPRRLRRAAGVADEPLGPVARERLRVVNTVLVLLEAGVSTRSAVQRLGLSRATVFRWLKAWRTDGPRGLEPRSRRPRRARRPTWSPELVRRVYELRHQYPWGKRKLAVLLCREGFAVSESTVGRILHHLMRLGRIRALPLQRSRRLVRAKRSRSRPHALPLARGPLPRCPGDRVQIDTLSVSLGAGVVIKHLTASDVVSRWNVGKAHIKVSSRTARRFLDDIERRTPFPVRSLQVDGGSEFMGEFEQACAQRGLPLYVLPPRSPELNGNVERAQGSWRYEFYWWRDDLPVEIDQLQPLVQQYERIFNYVRPHEGLHLLTPAEYLHKRFPGSLPESHMY